MIRIKGKEYGDCSFCRASCPSRDLFKEPDAKDIPLKCDMCGEPPPQEGPLCVRWCLEKALTYVEKKIEE
jgi:benzoyl-CoA reductase subunit BamC